MHYDYLVVGAGLFGAVFAYEMKKRGKTCYVIDKRNHVAGNVYTENRLDIEVHKYGAHIFHTSDKEVWEYVNGFAKFNHFINSPMAVYKDELYNLPFNMNTFSRFWNVKTPQEVKRIIAEQISELSIAEPKNLEEQAISLVGREIYEKLVKGYTEKQWGRDCKELPPFIIKRLPLRFTYDNNYFDDAYQGIPIGGYTGIIEKMLEGIDVQLGVSYQEFVRTNKMCKSEPGESERKREELGTKKEEVFDDKVGITYGKILYTGMIDEYFDFCLGHLEYRTVEFETIELENVENYQGNAVVNYTEREIPYTRIIEHKHFTFGKQKDTIISKEYPAEWKPGKEPYYPINNERNNELYKKYQELASKEENVILGGRLGAYQYYDMDKTILAAWDAVRRECETFTNKNEW